MSELQPEDLDSLFDQVLQAPSALSSQPPAAPAGGPLPATGAMGWFLSRGDQREGPLSLERLRERWHRGRLTPDTLCWRSGWAEWKPLSQASELVTALTDSGLPTLDAHEAFAELQEPASDCRRPGPSAAISALIAEEERAWRESPPVSPPQRLTPELRPSPEPVATPRPAATPEPAVAAPATASTPAAAATLEPASPAFAMSGHPQQAPVPEQSLPRRRPPWLRLVAAALALVAAGFCLVEALHALAPRLTGARAPEARSNTARPDSLSISAPEPAARVPAAAGASRAAPAASVPAPRPEVSPPETASPAPTAEARPPSQPLKSISTRVPETPASPPRSQGGRGAAPARPAREPERRLSLSLAPEAADTALSVTEAPEGSAAARAPERDSSRSSSRGGSSDFAFDDALDREFEQELGFTGTEHARSRPDTHSRRTVWIPPEPGTPRLESLSSLHLLQGVSPHQAALETCFQQHGTRSGPRRFVVRWHIRPDGTTSEVAVEARALKDTPLARCIESQVLSWRFPPHRVPRARPVRFTFSF